jgi:acyl-coenzyme A synthetase/AMP-(fatty) acid ligase
VTKLLEAFLGHVERRPDAPALIDGRGRITTYAEMARMSARRATAFREAGIGRGDIVLVARGVSPELYAALLALFRLGAVAMFPEPAAGLAGLAVAVEAARPKAMVAGALGRAVRLLSPTLRRLPLLSESGGDQTGDGLLEDVGAEAPALITFTSGSTGRPKGIVRSAGFLRLQHDLLERIRGTTPDDVDLISLPMFILSNLAAGATSVLPPGRITRPGRLDPERLRAQIQTHRVNRVVAPPAVCARLIEQAPGPLGVEAIFTGGGPVFPNLLKGLHAAAPDAAIHAVYGSTEAEPIAHIRFDHIGDAEWSAMAAGAGLLAGRPIPEATIALRDGEIMVAGPHVNRGYLDSRDDASTKIMEDGVLWHRTGDAARLDKQGRLWLLGRAEAAAGGLYPFAVETAALSWPEVRQAALLADRSPAVLVLAGNGLDGTALSREAAVMGDIVCHVAPSIPLDRRHNSKIDYAALRAMADRW